MPQPPQQIPVTTTPAKADYALLLRKIADGDVSALGALFDQTARQVYSLVMQLLRNHDEAEDIVESTFWQAWDEASQLADHPDPRNWLLSTGRKRALDQLRARRRQREELLMDKRQFNELVAVPAAEPDGEESRHAFLHTLRNLPNDERQVLELGYFRGLSQTDIADLIGESAATVKARMRSALAALRTSSSDEVVAQ